MDKIIIGEKTFEGYAIPTSKASLLLIRTNKGMLGCGYLKVETADKIGDVLAVVTGVNSYDDMLKAKVVVASVAARALGVKEGISGEEALMLMS